MDFIIEKLNLLSHPINLTYKNKNYFNSIFGACLSLLFYVVFICFIGYFSYDFIYGLNPKVNYKQSQINPKVNKKISQLVKEIKIRGKAECSTKKVNMSLLNSTELNKKMPNFTYVYLQVYNRTRNFLYVNNDIEIDSIEDLTSSVKGTYKYEIKYELTINSSSIFLGDKNMPIKFSDIEFNVKRADDIKITVLLMGSSGFYFKSTLFYLNFELYKNYFNEQDIFYSNDSTGSIMFHDKRIYHMYYSLCEIVEDYGWIFSKFIYKYFFEIKSFFFASIDTEYQSDMKFFDFLGEIRINIEKTMSTHVRVYKKLQNVFADLGGLFNAFLVIGNCIVSEFNKKKFNLDLMNEMYCADLIGLKRDLNRPFRNNKVLIGNKFRSLAVKIKNGLAMNKNKPLVVDNRNENKQENIDQIPDISKQSYNKESSKNVELRVDNREAKGDKCVNLKENFYKNELNDKENFTRCKSFQSQRKLDVDSLAQLNDFDGLKNLSELRLKDFQRNKYSDSPHVEINDKIHLGECKQGVVLDDLSEFEGNSGNRDINEKKGKIIEYGIEYYNVTKKIEKIISFDGKENKSKFLNYTSDEIFRSLLFLDKWKNEKIKAKDHLYSLAEQRINEYLDVFHIIKLTEMFGILKKILLNEEQNLCFDYIKVLFEPKKDKTQEHIKNELLDIYKYFKKEENTSNDQKESKENLRIEQNIKIKFYLQEEIKKLLDNNIKSDS